MNSLIVNAVLFAVVAAASAAVLAPEQRIVGGSLTAISSYPFAASMLHSYDGVNYRQTCVGTIISRNSVLSAAHCYYGDAPNRWRVRVGSTYANSGGVVHSIASILLHPSFNLSVWDNDVAILRTATQINYVNGAVQAASIPGSNYRLPDNAAVWSVGWGATAYGGSYSEQIRHVQIWTINQATCRQRYNDLALPVTDNMLCSGWLDYGGRGPCTGDNGSPLLHDGVVVGVHSWQENCAHARYPTVNTRVSRFTNWITANA